MTLSSTPESVVQRQLDAYNARDIDALMATYAEDAQQFEYPATLLTAGAAQVRERTATRFRESNLHARLIRRIVMGQVVIDHEVVIARREGQLPARGLEPLRSFSLSLRRQIRAAFDC